MAVPSLLAALAIQASRSAVQTSTGTTDPAPLRDVLSSLRYVASSGDELLPHTVQLLKQHLSAQAVLLNIYGCTETTADAMYHVCSLRDPALQDSTAASEHLPGRHTTGMGGDDVPSCQIPLGCPIGDTDVYVTPATDTQPVGQPTGCFRLLVVGRCLAGGYFATDTQPEHVVVTSLHQLEQEKDGGFLFVSAEVLQTLADRCADCCLEPSTRQP